jgi:hypothetical protein
MPEFLLAPFRRWLKPPVLDTPISTIAVPRPLLLMVIIFISFFVITGGFVFCWVRGVPFSGYVRTRDGRSALSWMEGSGSSQFLAEGVVAGLFFSASAASFICAFYVLGKPPGEPLTDLEATLRKFAFTAPLWCIVSCYLFKIKFGGFSPTFFR